MYREVSSREGLLFERNTRSRWTSRVRMSILGIGMILLVIGLIVGATIQTGMYFLTVDEFHARQDSLTGSRVRINGVLAENSEQWYPEGPRLEFRIRDAGGQHELPIVFHGPRPDNFQRAASAIVEGSLSTEGVFVAESLLLKCPSRYEEAPEEIFVKAGGS